MLVPSKAPISYQDAVNVIRRLLETAENHKTPFEEPIVMVGGTAMAAHNIRKLSYDVDLYARDFSDDVVYQVEQEFKRQFGNDFKIDVTSVENIWGDIMLRDIHESEPDMVMHSGNRDITIRKLSPEDLFLLKLDTGREKDQDDLFVLYKKTNSERLIERFNVVWKWHGNRDAVLGYADSFVSTLSEFSPNRPLDIVARLKLPEYMLTLLRETWSENNGTEV
jgi:hypothetical protein